MNQLKFKRLHPDAILPTRATAGSAGYDIASVEHAIIRPGEARTISTGIALELEPGYVANAYSRSGDGFKHDVSLSNSVGVIDSDYRGEIKLRLRNDGDKVYSVFPGARIAQIVVHQLLDLEPVWVDELTETARGEGGYGSTGR